MFSKTLICALIQVACVFIYTALGVDGSLSNSSQALDTSLYKDFNVTRGLTYHYYFSPPPKHAVENKTKPFLLFLHGFPSTSFDWHHQISFFESQGYGLLVPDMLGYGGTAKPLEPEAYASSLICKDLVDILDNEVVREVIVIGHDWGSKIAGRLANYFPERFEAFAFLSVGYFSPSVLETGDSERNNLSNAVLGYSQFGYWDFFSSEGAPKLIEDHIESFFSAGWPKNSIIFMTDFAPLGKLEAWLTADRRAETFVAPSDKAKQIEEMLKEGMNAPVNWYKILTSDIERNDNRGIPSQNLIITKPVFLGAALKDYIAIAPQQIASILQVTGSASGTDVDVGDGSGSGNGSKVTIRQYDSGHWVPVEVKDEVNADLLDWIEGL